MNETTDNGWDGEGEYIPNPTDEFICWDGESGQPIVRMTWAMAKACSASGDCTDAVRASLGDVEFIADADDIRKWLEGFGAWNKEELADDEANRERALWSAAGYVREELELFRAEDWNL